MDKLMIQVVTNTLSLDHLYLCLTRRAQKNDNDCH